ncbi:DUF2510 domain-containing protein [Leifsonia sp. NPDC058248]|uniref:DUF2510 domain-containing protein n=1 Tax=Leifsonia sp. NPDC058248 TaxID=3346402 RepID=UPI0036D87B36
MSNTDGQVPAGWYADPDNTLQLRWWDGAQWTEHYAPNPRPPVAPPVPPAPQPTPTALPAQPYVDTTVYTQATAAPERPKLAADARIYNPWIWLIVVLPFLSILILPFWNPLSGLSIVQTPDGQFRAFAEPGFFASPFYFVLIAVSFLANVLVVVFAYLDHRDLLRKGVERPFHWAWSFFTFLSSGFLVYVIGRSVIVRKVAPGKGLAPIWLAIALYALSIVIGIIWASAIFSSLAGLMHNYGASGV